MAYFLLAVLALGVIGIWAYDSTVLESMRVEAQLRQWETLQAAESNDGWLLLLVALLVVCNLVLVFVVLRRQGTPAQKQSKAPTLRRRRTAFLDAQPPAQQLPTGAQNVDPLTALLMLEMADRAEQRRERRRLPAVSYYDQED